MRSEVLKMAANRNVLLSPDALEYVMSNSDPPGFMVTVMTALSQNMMFIQRDDIIECLRGDAPVFESPKSIIPNNKKHYDISIVDGTDITGESICEGKIDDFARYFQSRYHQIKKVIEKRKDFGSVVTIEKAVKYDREVRVIGIVSESSITKNGHRMITLEDESRSCKALISKESQLINEIFVNDEVVGITGKPTTKGDMIIISGITRPGIPAVNPWKVSDSSASVAFLSDVHVGSYTFLETRWKNMITWLRETAYKTDLNYIILPGDVVDGIGIFPGQKEELSIDNIYKQYDALAEYLKEIPDHIKIVIQPGNHDAVRPAEPQPALSTVFTKMFDSNVIMTGNPVSIQIEGRRILTYHGRSIDDWVSGVQKLTYEDPISIMTEMLQRRHLAPMYGKKTALAPEKRDYLVIDPVPDIFVTGHVHGAGSTDYRGIKLIAASTWQDQTDYQRMHNFNPNPAIMPIVHLGSGNVTMKSF